MADPPTQVTIPLVNPNEPEALLAAVSVVEGQTVSPGDILCTLETTKSTEDVIADASGTIRGLRFSTGDTVRAGDLLCFISASPDWAPPEPQAALRATSLADDAPLPDGLRITQPALSLARRHGLDLARLPLDKLVTESQVRALISAHSPAREFRLPEFPFDPKAIIVYGGGGHGKALIDLLRLLGTYTLAGIVDDGLPAGGSILGAPILGGAESLPELYARGVRLAVNAVGGIGDVTVRMKVFERLAQAGFACPVVIHPAAHVELSASLSPGVQVFAHAYVGSDARVGYGAIVNTGAIVSHDCRLDEYVNISPGAILAGEVEIGAGALVGMGATVNLRVKIGAGARLGNGATIKSDVPEHSVVRAGAIWPA